MRLHTILAALVWMTGSTLVSAVVPDDPNKVTPIEVGSMAPSFTAQDVSGRDYKFDAAHLKKPAMLIFYRGGWCPFCNAHLKDLRSVVPKITALGYQVLFLSTDRPQLLYSSLKEKVPYRILSDASMQAARAFGVAFRLDEATLKMMQTYGIDLDKTQGTSNHELPVPSVFIISRAGVVQFRHFNADYRVRLDAASVLAAAQQALHK